MFMKKIISIFVLIILTFTLGQNVSAIAQVVEPILIEDALRGGEYEKMVAVFNTGEKEVEVNLTVVGDIKGWASFFTLEDSKISIKSIIIPPKSNKEAIVKFLIPQDAPNKIYFGKIVVSTSPEKSDGKGASAALIQEVPRKVSIKVTDEEVIDCEVNILPQSFFLEINEPFKTNVTYHNQSNVKIKPLIQQKIIKGEEIIFNVIYPYPEDKEGIKPGYSETVPIEWQTAGLEAGEYQAEISILLGEKIIKQKKFDFSIGAEVKVLGVAKAFTNSINFLMFKIMIIVLVLMIIITVYIKSDFFKKKSERIKVMKK